jgi:hypothetical protein
MELQASARAGSWSEQRAQAEIYSRVETVPQLWDWPDVLADAETVQTLSPVAAAKM